MEMATQLINATEVGISFMASEKKMILPIPNKI
jgi:hypothetical protein